MAPTMVTGGIRECRSSAVAAVFTVEHRVTAGANRAQALGT